MSKDTMDDGMEDVGGSMWFKFNTAGDTARGVFVEYFIKEANGMYGEQIVAVLSTPQGNINVGIPSKNPRYSGGIKNLKVGHTALIELEGFYNQDKDELVSEPGKTKGGVNFAKNYKIQQSKLPDPSYKSMVSATDVDNMFD